MGKKREIINEKMEKKRRPKVVTLRPLRTLPPGFR